MNEPETRRGTAFPELFAALAKEFPREEVKFLPKGGRQLAYVTARTVMNRLDEVLGPENWSDRYTPGSESVMCSITVRLPDGREVTKCDAGGYAGMSDSGDDDKSGFSDAFKRAAVKFGVGRHLYRDGVPNFEPPTEHHAANHQNGTGHGSGAYAKPETVKAYSAWVKAKSDEINAKWLDHNTGPGGEVPTGLKDLMTEWQLSGHLLKWARGNGLVNAPDDVRAGQRDKFAAVAWSRGPEDFETEANRYAREKWIEARKTTRPATTAPDRSDESEAQDPEVWPEGRE